MFNKLVFGGAMIFATYKIPDNHLYTNTIAALVTAALILGLEALDFMQKVTTPQAVKKEEHE